MARPAAVPRLTVHGGEARGRRLVGPPGIRPTQGMVVQAIFNMLGTAVLEAEVLDLFAGSGALGIEALSRGAASATFVERSEAGCDAIRRNLEVLGYGDRGRVVRAEAVTWVRGHPDLVAGSGVVLLDPPYRETLLDAALVTLDPLVGAGARVVAEHWTRQPLPGLQRLAVVRARRYGDTSVTIAQA